MKNFYKITRALAAEKNFFKITRALAAEKHFKLFYLLIALMASTTFAWADDSGTCGTNLTWSYVESTHTLTISGTGAMTNYDSYSSLAPWNTYKDVITTVVIESGATTIGENAFYQCTALGTVSIPNSVTSIGKGAFYKCSSLTSVSIPSNVIFIGEYAFNECTSLGSIVIPTGVTSIERGVFYRCSSLTSVSIPNSVTNINQNAFEGCSGLTSITIPASVTSIVTYAFHGCSGLTSITVEDGNTIYDSRNNCNAIIETASNKLIVGCRNTVIPNTVTSIGDYAFMYCVSLPSVTFPNSVTSIGKSVFNYCSDLTSINIPASVTSIGTSAFGNCTGLTDVYVNWTNLSGVTEYGAAFYNTTLSGVNLHVPYGTSSVYEGTKPWSDFKSIIEGNPSGQCGDKLTWEYNPTTFALTITGSGAMYDYTYDTQPWKDYRSNITSVSLPDGLTHIGNFAFYYCTLLSSITIPSSVTSIGNYAFLYCVSLPSVTLLNGLTSIGEHAFSGTALTSVTIPGSVTSLGVRAFASCSGLADVTVNWDTPIAISSNTFDNIASPANLHVPYGTKAAYEAATGWNNFNSFVEINPNGTCGDNLTWEYDPSTTTLTITGTGAMTHFNNSYKAPWYTYKNEMTTVVIESGATTIGDFAFLQCTALTSIDIPSGVTRIGLGAFNGCSGLTSITIPASVTRIEGSAFFGCTALASITIPASVTNIGSEAFKSCNALESISVEAGNTIYDSRNGCNAIIQTSYNSLIYGCKNTVIPNSVTSIGDGAFYNCTSLTSITIPSSVTSIKYSAFAYCTNLTSINIPTSVTSIGQAAFRSCTALTSVTIPADVISIGNSVFQGCSALKDITVNWTNLSGVSVGSNVFQSVTTSNVNLHVPHGTKATYQATAPWSSFNIVEEAFPNGTCGDNLTWEYNPSTGVLTITGSGAMTDYSNSDDIPWYDFTVDITSLVLPEGLTTIGTNAFVLIYNLTSINIPASVTGIGEAAFYYCTSLASVTFAEGSQLTSIGDAAFGACPALSSITIPTGVTSIGNGAFEICSGLTSVTIPAGVNSIDDSAFAKCTSLTDMYVNWTNPGSVYLGADLFFTVDLANVNLHVPAGTKATYEAIYPWMYFNIIEPLPSGSCGDNLFWEYNPTTTTLTITGTGAMTSYSKNAIPWKDYKNSITSVVLPEGLTNIVGYAISDCTALTSIEIPSTVKTIISYALQGCTNLQTVHFADGSELTSILTEAFGDCTALTSINLPNNNLSTISFECFINCTSLTSITLPNSLTELSPHAFKNCSSLASVIFEDGCQLTTIQSSTFNNCTNLTSINLPNTISSIQSNAFRNSGLTSIIIPTGMTSINQQAFEECIHLATVTIHENVTSIESSAFKNCSLEDVYINCTTPPTAATLNPGYTSFDGITLANVNLHLPFEAWSNYEAIAPWSGFKQVPMITAKADPENGGVYYNTFYHGSVAYALPSGVEAYTAQRSGSDLILTKIAQADDVLPANTAVILKSSVEQFEMTPSDASPVTVGENDLQGVDAATAAPSNCYVLSGKASDNSVTGVGFYQFGGTLGAHKAYMVVSGGAGAPKRLRFVFDAATGVESLVRPASDVSSQKVLRDGQLIIIRNGAEYNANGQRIK